LNGKADRGKTQKRALRKGGGSECNIIQGKHTEKQGKLIKFVPIGKRRQKVLWGGLERKKKTWWERKTQALENGSQELSVGAKRRKAIPLGRGVKAKKGPKANEGSRGGAKKKKIRLLKVTWPVGGSGLRLRKRVHKKERSVTVENGWRAAKPV